VAVDHTSETYSSKVEAETRDRIVGRALRPEAMHAETHRRGTDFFHAHRLCGGRQRDGRGLAAPLYQSRSADTRHHRPDDRVSRLNTRARQPPQQQAGIGGIQWPPPLRSRFYDASAEALPRFAGATQLCRVLRRRAAGFPIERIGTETCNPGKLWFARLLPGDLMIPVRGEFNTEFGTFIAELAELRAAGAWMQFTE
jgi:hypothetical protein